MNLFNGYVQLKNQVMKRREDDDDKEKLPEPQVRKNKFFFLLIK